MNILIVYNRPPIPTSGGVAKMTSILVEELTNNGHHVWVLSYRQPCKTLDVNNIIQIELDSNKENQLAQVCTICVEKDINIIIDQEPIDEYWMHERLVCAKDSYGCKLISCFHNPVISQVKNIHYRKEFYLESSNRKWVQKVLEIALARQILLGFYCKKYRKKYRNIVDTSDRVVLLCEGMKDELLQMIGRKTISNACIIPNFCDVKNEMCDTNIKKNVIVWCGNIDFDIKRTDIAIKVWSMIEAKLPGWELRILGDGKDISIAQELIKKYNLRKCFLMGRCNPFPHYQDAKMTLVTSSFESFSLVTLESQRFGCVPIVFNTFPAASMLIDNEINGILVEPYDFDIYAKHILKIAEDNSLYARLSVNAVENSNRYIPENIGKLWDATINNC